MYENFVSLALKDRILLLRQPRHYNQCCHMRILSIYAKETTLSVPWNQPYNTTLFFTYIVSGAGTPLPTHATLEPTIFITKSFHKLFPKK